MEKRKLHIILFYTLILFAGLILQLPAQCPTYGDLLDKGWAHLVGQPHNPKNGNFDEFAITDPSPFIVKVGTYPPVNSFAFNPSSDNEFSQCSQNTFYYFSFDTDPQYFPINYIVPKQENTLVKTYRMGSNGNYTSGYSVIVTPPYGGGVDFLHRRIL